MTAGALRGLVWTPDGEAALDLRDIAGGLWFTVTAGLDDMPPLRGNADGEVVPYLAGRRFTAVVPDARPVVLEGVLLPATEDGYPDLAAALASAFDPYDTARGVLAVTMEDGGVRTILGRPRSIAFGDPPRVTPTCSIELDAEPFWRSPADWGDWHLDAGLFLDDGWRLDESSVITITDPSTTTTFDARSTTPITDATVEVDGPSVEDVTVQTADGIGFTFLATLAAGETLAIDCGAHTCLLDGAYARGTLRLLDANERGEYLRLGPGSTTVTVSGHPAEVRIAFKPTYL